KGDAKAVAVLWAETGVLVSDESGERLKGRSAIEKEYAAQLAGGKGTQMALALETIRPITADVASVEGTAKFVKVGQPLIERPFSGILVKKEGKWLIDSLRHGEMTSTPGHYEQLKELEWMIGEWEDVDKDADIRIVCAWTAGKNFMTRSFTVTVDGT